MHLKNKSYTRAGEGRGFVFQMHAYTGIANDYSNSQEIAPKLCDPKLCDPKHQICYKM